MDAKRGDDRWCIADVRFKHTPPLERHTWIEAPFNENRAVWQHLMGDAVWRIDYQMAPNTDPAYASREDVVRERLQRQFGKDIECDIVWVGPYAYKSQCLHHLRAGHVFFAGDTAKVVSPFGARGGNTGIADADNLAWKIAAVVKNQAPAQLLHSYNDERLEAAQVNVQVTQRTARFLRPADGTERLFRNAAIALAKRHAFARPLINTGRMAVANRYHRSRVCAQNGGISVQNVSLRGVSGEDLCLNDLLRWADGHLLLLLFGYLTPSDLKRVLQLTPHAPLRAVQVVSGADTAQAVEHVLDAHMHLRQACHAGQARWALLRPDAYLAATGTALDGRWIQAVAKALAMAD
jgi:3-(3-hydroxy-phenyl)propionate hydroxylase